MPIQGVGKLGFLKSLCDIGTVSSSYSSRKFPVKPEFVGTFQLLIQFLAIGIFMFSICSWDDFFVIFPRTFNYLIGWHKVIHNVLLKLKTSGSLLWWHIFIIPVVRKLRQENCHNLEVNLSYRMRSCFNYFPSPWIWRVSYETKEDITFNNRKKKNNWCPVFWCTLLGYAHAVITMS